MDPDPLSCILNIVSLVASPEHFITFNYLNTSSIIAGLVAICALFLSAFISGSEIAYFSLTNKDLENIKNDSDKESVEKLLSNPERLLATILISNNLVNVTIVILCNHIMNQVFEINSGVLNFIIQTVILTFLILLFGEIIPKLYASNNNVKFAVISSGGLRFMSALFKPLSSILAKSTFIVNKVVTKRAHDISMEDLSQALEISDVKSTNEKELLKGILRFGATTVVEIMHPRIDVVDIDYNDDFNEVVRIVTTNGYSRMPVFEESPDNIKGILYAKDLLPYIGKRESDFKWQTLLREAYFVPETRMIDDLLEDFRTMKIHMAVVVDEFGCRQGIATLEDVLASIVGCMAVESDSE